MNLLQPRLVGRSGAWLVAGVLLAVLLVVGLGALPAGVTASEVEVDRNITNTEVEPGESTTITVSLEADAEDDFGIAEELSPAFAAVSIENTSPDPLIQAVRDDQSGVVVIWENTASASITYEVTIPEDAAEGDTFEISNADTTDTIDVIAPETGDDDTGSETTAGDGVSDTDETISDTSEESLAVSIINTTNGASIEVVNAAVGDFYAANITNVTAITDVQLQTVAVEHNTAVDEYQISISDPVSMRPDRVSALSDAESLAFAEINFTSPDETTRIDAITIEFAVSGDVFSGGLATEDVRLYQTGPDGWVPVETTQMTTDTDGSEVLYQTTLMEGDTENIDIAVAVDGEETPESDTSQTESDTSQTESDTSQTESDTSQTESDTPQTESSEDSVPGFGVTVSILAVSIVLLAARRLRE